MSQTNVRPRPASSRQPPGARGQLKNKQELSCRLSSGKLGSNATEVWETKGKKKKEPVMAALEIDNAERWLHINTLEATEAGWSDIREGTVLPISRYGGDYSVSMSLWTNDDFKQKVFPVKVWGFF